MSALDMIDRFGVDVTVTRYAAGTWTNGIYSDGTPTSIPTKMSIQPTSGIELLLLPEGERTRNYCKAYSPIELFTVDQLAKKKADKVTAPDGSIYEVQKVYKMEAPNLSIAPHWKVTLAKVSLQ